MPSTFATLAAAAWVATFLGGPCLASAQSLAVTPGGRAPRTGTARVVSTAPTVDGRLNERVWAEAESLTDFLQREPSESAPVSERTVVRILTDREALYVGAWLLDRHPTAIVPGEKVRDGTLTNSDYFAVILDTFFDRQNGFIFATTPAGIEYDGQIIREGEGGGVFQSGQNRAQVGAMGGFNLNWDGSWTVASSADSLGWYAEMRIPFSTLRYGGASRQTWGLNLVRMIRRNNEEAFWSFIPRQFNLYRLSLAGTLEDVEVPVRKVATVTPYVLSSARRDYRTDPRTGYQGDAGADAKYGLTPSLTLDLTYNTDFAQVEVDEQRTNLTRFPLFFPEKRPFFLENAGVFSAGTPQAVDLFFTRRIGIDSAGSPVPIVGGGRLSGRIGGTTLGLLGIVTDPSTPGQSGQAYGVARVLREVSRRSRVGLIAVERQARGAGRDHNLTLGADGRLGVGDDWTVDFWGAKTETPGKTGDDLGYSVRAAFLTRDWNNNVRVLQVGGDFNPEVGFLNRTGGYRYYELMVMRYVRSRSWKNVRVWNPHVTAREYFRLDGFHQSGWIHVDMTEVEFTSGGRLGPEVNVYHEGLQQPFAIASNVTLPAGSYDYATLGLDWSTDPSAPLSIALRGDFGPFYTGSRSGTSSTITYRRGASLSASLITDYNDVRLAEGHFLRSLLGLRLAYFFTPRVFVQTLTQYNKEARVWTANARFGWLNTAGTGLYVVFNDGEEADGAFTWVRPQTRAFVVKFTRQLGTGG
ncbi:MAG TPA: DUF5916 domain-containing protein [Gemmatimonadaceae bacterium]|nr:DUF5916 domain-containing protein [Gemmatimonadaceae bacterium]